MVTVAPGVACAGVTETMRGATRKSVALVAVPAGLATPRRPVVAPAGTTTRSEVADTIVTGLALRLPPALVKVTPVTLARLVPLRVTRAPSAPTAGLKLLRVGALMTTNGAGLVAVPPGVVTVTGAVVAAAGTVVVMVVSLTTWESIPATDPNRTALAFVKLVPTIVTSVPTTPSSGVRLVIRGVTLKHGECSSGCRPDS